MLNELPWGSDGYGRMRLCRCLFIAAQWQYVDDEEDWELDMTPDVTQKVRARACYSHRSALQVQQIMRDLTENLAIALTT